MNRMLVPLFILALSIVSCSKSKNMEFCEGISMEGEGVNCGSEFESGDLMVLVKSKEPFNQERISFDIYEVAENKKEKVDTIHANIKTTDTSANATLPLYTEGKFHVKAVVKDRAVAEGDITIVDY